MTGEQQNRLSMYLAVLGVMAKYNSVWAALTAIADMVTRLQDLTSSIQESSGVQGSPLTGIAGGKRRKRMEMMEQTVAIAGDLHAMAVKNNDASLEAKTDFELTDLVRLGETVVGPRCEEIRGFANTNAATLASGYGVDAADITALQTAITDFKGLLTKPRQAVVARKEVRGDIADDEAAADKLLEKEMDKTMRKFKTKNAPFFGEYTSARMIVDLGAPHAKPAAATGTTPAKPTP